MGAMTTTQVISLAVTLALGLAALAWQVFSWRRAGSKIKTELGVGQVDEEGALTVEFASGKSNIIVLPEPAADVYGPIKRSTKRGKKSTARPSKKFKPVNAIFIHNKGRTARSPYHGATTGQTFSSSSLSRVPQSGGTAFRRGLIREKTRSWCMTTCR